MDLLNAFMSTCLCVVLNTSAPSRASDHVSMCDPAGPSCSKPVYCTTVSGYSHVYVCVCTTSPYLYLYITPNSVTKWRWWGRGRTEAHKHTHTCTHTTCTHIHMYTYMTHTYTHHIHVHTHAHTTYTHIHTPHTHTNTHMHTRTHTHTHTHTHTCSLLSIQAVSSDPISVQRVSVSDNMAVYRISIADHPHPQSTFSNMRVTFSSGLTQQESVLPVSYVGTGTCDLPAMCPEKLLHHSSPLLHVHLLPLVRPL